MNETGRHDWYCTWWTKNNTKTSGTFSGMTRQEVVDILTRESRPDSEFTVDKIEW